MLGDLIGRALGLPFRVANVPLKVAEELAAKADEDDDSGLRSLTSAAATPLDVVADVLEDGATRAIDGEDDS